MASFNLVRSVGQATVNVSSFTSAMMASAFSRTYNPMSEILAATQSWYAYEYETDEDPSDSGFYFAPSKYAGYQEMHPDLYLANNGENGSLNGRDTEKALRSLSTPLMPGDSRYDVAHKALVKFCALFDKVPNARARISMLDLARDEELDRESVQIKALTLLISTLSDAGRVQLKRAAFP